MGPILVGGTGRSGTAIVAGLIAAHPEYTTIGAEARFHAAPHGLADLVEDRVDPETFLRALRGQWFAQGALGRTRSRAAPRVPRGAVRSRGRGLRARCLTRSARALVRDLLDPIPAAAGCSSWVESTPPNMAAAPGLARILPTARFIHCVRDGADVACSVARQPWGPDSPREALLWWRDRFSDATKGEHAVPGRVHRVYLDRLVGGAREDEYERLIAFLGFDGTSAMRRYLDAKVRRHLAHPGRWRTDLPESERTSFAVLATSVNEQLADAGMKPPPTTAVGMGPASALNRAIATISVWRWDFASRINDQGARSCGLRSHITRVLVVALALRRWTGTHHV